MNRSIPLKTVLLIAVPSLLLVLCLAAVVGFLVIDDLRGLLDDPGPADPLPAAPGDGGIPPDDPAPPSGGPLTLGDRREILVEDVGSGGGTLVVDAPGDPLDGLTLEIPAGAYPGGTTVKVRARPIEDHSFGPDFNPASPLIEIDAGDALAEEFVSLTLPAGIAPDAFGMAFAYEAEDGAIEGLTYIDAGADGVRTATRALSRNVLVSTVDLDRLDRDIETGFEPGVDDWQFRNFGSVLAPKGHCAGQSLAALYYFIEGLGAPLYGQHDNFDHAFPPDTPGLQWDDEEAWRLVSMVQETIGWETAARKFWIGFAGAFDDPGIYNAFAYSMLLTGQPQYVGIYSDAGGHALIVYGKRGDSLLVSDPNYPAWSEGGKDRTIDYSPDLDGFYPYYSGPNADDLGHAFDDVVYFGYRDLIDWQALGALWADLEAGVVGDGHFPAYRLMVREGDAAGEAELWSGHEAAGSEITVRVEAEFAPYLFAYHPDAKLIAFGEEPLSLTLDPGDNDLGFLIAALVDGKPAWVGFDWVRIRRAGGETTGSTGPTGTRSYAGTWSGFDGGSGEFEFYAYATGDVYLKYRKTADSNNESFTPSTSWNSVSGTHENGEFVLPFNEWFSVTGTFTEASVSGSGSNEYGNFQFSGTRVD